MLGMRTRGLRIFYTFFKEFLTNLSKFCSLNNVHRTEHNSKSWRKDKERNETVYFWTPLLPIVLFYLDACVEREATFLTQLLFSSDFVFFGDSASESDSRLFELSWQYLLWFSRAHFYIVKKINNTIDLEKLRCIFWLQVRRPGAPPMCFASCATLHAQDAKKVG